MPVELNRVLQVRLINQIKLAQTKYQPPAGQRHCEDHPQADEGDDDLIAFSFHAQSQFYLVRLRVVN